MRSMLPRILFSMCTVGLYLFALSCIPLPTALSTSDRMTATLSRLLVVGTTILGLLAGFGAASSSWDFIPSRRPRYGALWPLILLCLNRNWQNDPHRPRYRFCRIRALIRPRRSGTTKSRSRAESFSGF
jgi:hypothetical protein